MDVTFIAEKKGLDFVGQVIDLATQNCVARTGLYASAETAKSAAAGMWRAMQAPGELLAQGLSA
jgi:hypothetical protein